LLTENASDTENIVRFAIHSENQPNKIIDFINILISDSKIELICENIKNQYFLN
jgi:hypothetical protein